MENHKAKVAQGLPEGEHLPMLTPLRRQRPMKMKYSRLGAGRDRMISAYGITTPAGRQDWQEGFLDGIGAKRRKTAEPEFSRINHNRKGGVFAIEQPRVGPKGEPSGRVKLHVNLAAQIFFCKSG